MTCRFDYYSATLDEPPHRLADVLMASFPDASDVLPAKPKNGYRSALAVKDQDGDTLATILSGSHNAPPNAFASGERASHFAAIIREHWPDAHHVTRLDSCTDLPASFHDVVPHLQQKARALGIKGRTIMPDNPQDGATYYMGSSASRVQARIYEKGKELRARGVSVPDEALGLLRFEVQLRPTKDGKVTAAHLSPDQAWGATGWTRGIALDFLGHDPGRVPMQLKLLATFERRTEVMLSQWGPHIVQMARRAGGWAALAQELAVRLDASTGH